MLSRGREEPSMEIEAHESKALRSHFKLYQPVENSVNESKCETSVASYASNVCSGCFWPCEKKWIMPWDVSQAGMEMAARMKEHR